MSIDCPKVTISVLCLMRRVLVLVGALGMVLVSNPISRAVTAVDGVTEVVSMNVKDNVCKKIIFVTYPNADMRKKRISIKFNAQVWLEKNEVSDIYKVTESGNTLKVKWKKNRRKRAKLVVGFGACHYMKVIIRVKNGVG